MKDEIIEKNKNINRGFRKLEIWKLSVELYSFVHEIICKNISVNLKIKSQIEDSAMSISSNIAEGYSRRSLSETLRFYEIAFASSAENYSQIFTLFNAGQISKSEFDEFDQKSYELENKIIKMNKDLVFRLKSHSEWQTDYE
jgi:four helix bundle protein